MEGKYSVEPFSRPLGLAEAADVYGLSAPLGTPVFKVVREAGKFKHIGLVSGSRFDIKLQNKTAQQLASLDNAFGTPTIRCSYKLGSDIYVIKVDLRQIDETSLVEMANYIPRTWGSAIIDLGRGDVEEIYKNPSVSKNVYRLDSKSLRSVHYFLIQDIEMIGVISYVVMIPLQKSPL